MCDSAGGPAGATAGGGSLITDSGERAEMPNEPASRAWSRGSYDAVSRHLVPMAARLVAAAGVEAGDRVLDVACGTGNAAITAARRGGDVTGLDAAPAMLDGARANAAIAGDAGVTWQAGDAAALPFADDTFDVTVSCVGNMFADRPEAVAAELCRVTRPGGRLAFTAWTPSGVFPQLLAVLGSVRPVESDPSGSPFRWAVPAVVRERLGADVTDLDFETGVLHRLALSPGHFWDDLCTNSPHFVDAMAAVNEADRAALEARAIATIAAAFDDARNTVSMEYRLVTATVR